MKKELFNVYSSMLGGYIAMGFKSKEDAQKFINEYHCEYEKKGMTVTGGAR